MCQPRYRLRTLLVAVAVVAVALGGWRLWERWGWCRSRARNYPNVAEELHKIRSRAVEAEQYDRLGREFETAARSASPGSPWRHEGVAGLPPTVPNAPSECVRGAAGDAGWPPGDPAA